MLLSGVNVSLSSSLPFFLKSNEKMSSGEDLKKEKRAVLHSAKVRPKVSFFCCPLFIHSMFCIPASYRPVALAS